MADAFLESDQGSEWLDVLLGRSLPRLWFQCGFKEWNP